jgi:hypothetical protein
MEILIVLIGWLGFFMVFGPPTAVVLLVTWIVKSEQPRKTEKDRTSL